MANSWQMLFNSVRGDLQGEAVTDAQAQGNSTYSDTHGLRWAQDFVDLYANRVQIEELTLDAISVVSGTQEYDLPSNWLKIKTVIGVNPNDSTQYELLRFDPDADVATRGSTQASGALVGGYYLWGFGDATQGSGTPKIGFLPSPVTAQSINVRYIRTPARPTALTDTCDFPSVWYPAIKEFNKMCAANMDQQPQKEQTHERRMLSNIRRARSYRAEPEEGYLTWRR